jgi:HTH-type transcriptional regulator / antitoxin HigA
MKTLKYTVIKSRKQYYEYCKVLEKLINNNHQDAKDEIELLTLLIEKWDAAHSMINEEVNPIELLTSLMHDNHLKAKDLVRILGVSKGLVSDILHYKKGISKELIRLLAKEFKLSQEAFNRPYKLQTSTKPVLEKKGVMKPKIEMV